MLYANLLMFCSRSTASQCCSLQPLSFTGFLKGYFIACHYHSLWLYGLCSVLVLSRLPLAPRRSSRAFVLPSASFLWALLPPTPPDCLRCGPLSVGQMGECHFNSGIYREWLVVFLVGFFSPNIAV